MCYLSHPSLFAIRGVSAFDKSETACALLSKDFKRTDEMYTVLGLSNDNWNISTDAHISVDANRNKDGCVGQYRVADGNTGIYVKTDRVELQAKNNYVYFMRSNQELSVGEELADCELERNIMMETLIHLYGNPTSHDASFVDGESSEYLIWDYSIDNELNYGDKGLEYYSVNISCSIHNRKMNFAKMRSVIEFHSGTAIENSESKAPKPSKLFLPSL